MAVRRSLVPLLRLGDALNHPQPERPVTERRAAAARNPVQMRTVMRHALGRLSITDHPVAVTGGQINVRVYRPSGAAPRPGLVFIHGGAFWLESVAQYGPLCRWYALKAGCVVVSVGYRLAPESPYPGPVEDCYAALGWTVDNAGRLGIDPARIGVGGVSAGGGLAAATALMARDRGGPALRFQLLEIPVTDTTLSRPSVEEFATGYGLTRAELAEGYGFYLPDAARAREPYASPLLASDLTGLPPAFVLTCECDPLRDEGEDYAARLRASGVDARQYRAAGHIHGSTYMTRVLPSAREALAATTSALADAL